MGLSLVGIHWVASKDPSSSDHLRVWEPVLRAPFGDQWSLDPGSGQSGPRSGIEAWYEGSQEGGVWGPLALWRPAGSGRGFLLEWVTVASQLPACHTKQF